MPSPSNNADFLVAKKSVALFVILMKDDQGKPSLMFDPGMSRPWSSTNENLAKFYASSCDGEAHTWASAWQILCKAHPTFEKDLYARLTGQHNPKRN